MASDRAPRLLVVDDYPANVLALSVALRPLGPSIVEAFSASEAIAHAQNEQFDGILMDVRLPDLDGFEACTQIQRSERNRGTPVLFHSAEDLSRDELQMAVLRSDMGVLRKPVDPGDLVRKVCALLGRG